MRTRHIGCLSVIGVFAILVIIMCIQETNATKDVMELVEKGEYTKAKQAAINGSAQDKYKVTNAQVSEIIERGDFDLAAEIAKEDNFYITYFDGIVNHLSKIYNQFDGNKVFYALSLIHYPEPKEQELPSYWGTGNDENPTSIIQRNNKNIESFCEYLKQCDETSYISKMLTYLRPVWVPAQTKWDSEKQESVILKDGYLDNSEMNRIKRKFGN